MKPSARRIERLLAKVEADLACSARSRRYVFHYDEVAEAEAQGLPYVLVPRKLSREEWEKKYCHESRSLAAVRAYAATCHAAAAPPSTPRNSRLLSPTQRIDRPDYSIPKAHGAASAKS
jgi:hypothetical protein